MRMPLQPRQLAVTFTFDLQNLIRSSVGASKYSLQVLLRLIKLLMRHHGNKICLYTQLQSITALSPVLISLPAEGRRLSCSRTEPLHHSTI